MSDTLIDDVREILRRAERPLDVRDVYARSNVADGMASVAHVLHRLAAEGAVDVVYDEDGSRRLYRIADADAEVDTAQSLTWALYHDGRLRLWHAHSELLLEPEDVARLRRFLAAVAYPRILEERHA